MPNAFVSLVLVVLCAAAYMHFTQPSSPPPPASARITEARRVQSIIDIKSVGEEVRTLDLVSASGEPKKITAQYT